MALLGLSLSACGGSGGGGTPVPAVESVDVGLLSSSAPTRVEVTIRNPLAEDVLVRLVDREGPFVPEPGELPTPLPAGGARAVGLLFTPAGPGPVEGRLALAFDGATARGEATYVVSGTAEPIAFFVFTPTLDFGVLTVGQTAEQTLTFLNDADLSAATLTSAAFPPGGFSVVGSPFPLTLDPGQIGTLRVRYAPTQSGLHDGTLGVGPFDPGGGFQVQLRASASGLGEEQVVDFGTQSLDGAGRTPVLNLAVPADAVSLTVEGWGASSDVVGLDTLTGPGAKVYENTSSTGAYVWSPGVEIFSTTVPNTDRTNVQLVPGGGTWSFSLRRLQGSSTTLRVRAIVERRPPGNTTTGVLDLNVFLAQGIPPTAATAASDARLQAILTQVDNILRQRGISVGSISYHDVTDPAYDDVTFGEFPQMLATWTAQASATRLNLFFVRQAIGGGVVGVSAAVSGPKRNGTTASGVMSVYDGFSAGTVGLIAAHEIGHYLGLYHTTEQDGSHDFIDDTAQCPANGTNATCPTPGGGYLMHWQAVGGTTLTSGQGLVLRAHPHMAPGTGGSSKPGPTPPTVIEAHELGQGWCATCTPPPR